MKKNEITYQEASELLQGLLKSKSIRVETEHKFSYAWTRNYDKLVSIQKIIEGNRYPKDLKPFKAYFEAQSLVESKMSKSGLEVGSGEYKVKMDNELDEVGLKFPVEKAECEAHQKWFAEEFILKPVEFEPYKIKAVYQPCTPTGIPETNIPPMQMEQRAGCNFFIETPE